MAIKVNGNTVIDDSRNANVEALNVVSNTANIGTTLYVVANGNVGVGNSAPAHKLRVSGDISLTGGIHANGSLGTDGSVLISNGSGSFWGSVPSSANIQEFTSSGTWVKPAGMQVVYIQLIGGGGGGGAIGGYGGGGGAYSDVSMLASQLTSNVTVTIGAGGAQTAAGGNTSFGSYLVSGGGAAGISGGYSPPSTPLLRIGANGGIAYFITANTSIRQGQTAQIVTGLYAHANVSDNQANVANVANVVSAFTSIYGGGRGGGGGNTSANNQFLGSREGGGSVRGAGAGGASGFANATQGQTLGSNGGFSYSSNGGLSGGNGVDRPANTIFVHGGSGGGGGASGANNVNGSNGGNGGYPGGGGGGGGASGAANSLSGSGGTGANGYALIITW
jgi:hypothetical protein